jgi:hypothetical protein
MNIKAIALTTLVATIGSTVPATAQRRNPSQEFFEQGWERLEREIQILQAEPLKPRVNLEKPPSQPVLEVSPSPANLPSKQPNELEKPSPRQQLNERGDREPGVQNYHN